MSIPTGKGFFVEYIDHVGKGDWGSIIPTGQNLGLKWLAVRIMVGRNIANTRGAGILTKDYAANLQKKCAANNLPLFGYLDFNSEDNFSQQASKAVSRATSLGLAGLIVHPIVPSKKLGDFFMVLDHPNLSVGLMSDMGPSEYRSPNIVGSSIDFFMPYKVWGKGGSPTAWVNLYIDFRKYSQKPVIPVAPAYMVEGWEPKPTEIAAFVQRAVVSDEDVPGVGFWKWDDKNKTGIDYSVQMRQAIMSDPWRETIPADGTTEGSDTSSSGTTQDLTPPTPVTPTIPPSVTPSLDLTFTADRWAEVYQDYLIRNGKS